MVVNWYKDGKPVNIGHRFRNTLEYGFCCLDLLYALPDDSGEYEVAIVSETFKQVVDFKILHAINLTALSIQLYFLAFSALRSSKTKFTLIGQSITAKTIEQRKKSALYLLLTVVDERGPDFAWLRERKAFHCIGARCCSWALLVVEFKECSNSARTTKRRNCAKVDECRKNHDRDDQTDNDGCYSCSHNCRPP